jgi:hypothetical protein
MCYFPQGVCSALTIYSVVSLALYNRRQRTLWLDRQLEELQNARLAYADGTATPDQLEILRNEKIGEIEKQKKQEADEKRLWSRVKRYLFNDLKKEEIPVGESVPKTTMVDGSSLRNKPSVFEALHAQEQISSSLAGKEEKPTSGISPQLGEAKSSSEVVQTKRSWISWITGRQ